MKNVVSPVLAGFSLLVVGGIITNSIIDGEQLVIKFLATIVVAALGLYIISDLRLRQSENSAISSNQSSTIDTIQQTESGLPSMPIIRSKASEESATTQPPSNSTATFMANMNKTKGRGLDAASNDRSYSAMGRINQRRRRRSTEAEQPVMAPVVSLKKATPPEQTAPSTDPNESEQPDFDETTLNAAPLEPLRAETPIEGLRPVEPNTADTILPGVYSPVIDIEENPTSILSIPTVVEDDDPDFDESATWILVDDPTEESNDNSQGTVADSFHLEEVETEQTVEDDDINDIESLFCTDDTPKNDVPASDITEAKRTERRRFAPEDINIRDLRSVDFETVQEPTRKASPTTKSASQAPGDEAAGNAAPTETRTTSSLAAINDAIADGEQTIVGSLIERGVLSSKGPISDDDVTTMIYVAFTSSELRKLLQEGGTMDTNDGPISLEGLGIYTTDELEKDGQFLVVGPDETVNQLETKASI